MGMTPEFYRLLQLITTTTTTTTWPWTAPPYAPGRGLNGRFPVMSDFDVDSPQRFPDIRFFSLKFVFRRNVTMSEEERIAQKLRLFAVRRVPLCHGNVIQWPNLGDVHPLFRQHGYPGRWAFFIKYWNPKYTPFDAENYWFARHKRGYGGFG